MHDEPYTKEEVPRLGFEPVATDRAERCWAQQMHDDARGIARLPVEQE